jgi:hypothetical protein
MTTPITPLGEVVIMPLAEMKPYPANARRITDRAVEQTAKSLAAFGWQQPIVLDTEHVIVVGHVRHRAATTKLGQTMGPAVIAADLTPEQLRAYRIADNRTHDYTTWDYTTLAAELDGLGHEFDGVLDLADWGALIAAFEAAGNGERDLNQRTSGRVQALTGGGYTVTVVFASRDDADRAGPDLLAVNGVVDVRFSR